MPCRTKPGYWANAIFGPSASEASTSQARPASWWANAWMRCALFKTSKSFKRFGMCGNSSIKNGKATTDVSSFENSEEFDQYLSKNDSIDKVKSVK